MKGLVVDAVSNEEDRTADLTVELSSDTGVLVSTKTMLVSIDDLAKPDADAFLISRLTDLVQQEITNSEPLPLTEQQVKDKTVGRAVYIPG